MPVFVGVLTVELHLPEALSLKDKRQVLQSLLARLQGRLGVSAAEVDHQEAHQRAALAVACVSNAERQCDQVLGAALRLIESEPRALVTHFEREIG